MESTGPNGYALFGAMGVVDWILQSLSKMGAGFPFESSSIAIALALMVGLKHPIRPANLRSSRAPPGGSLPVRRTILNLAVGTARYHLDALAREGLVYKHDTNGRARYYVTGGEADVNRLYAGTGNTATSGCGFTVRCVASRKAQPATIAKVLGISRQLVSYHLTVLEKAGWVPPTGRSLSSRLRPLSESPGRI